MAKTAPTIDDVLKLAEQVDEDAIDAEIASVEKQLARLRSAKRTIHVLKHGKPARKPITKKAKSTPGADATKSIKQRLIDYLEVQSPAKPGIIAGDTGLQLNQVTAALANYPDIFRRVPDGYTLVNGVRN